MFHSRVSGRHDRALLSLFFRIKTGLCIFLFKVSLFTDSCIFTVQHLDSCSLCRICGDKIKDYKPTPRYIHTNRLVSEIHQIWNQIGWILQTCIHVKKKKEKRQISTVNDVLRYSLNTDNLGWILTLQVRQQAKKVPGAWSPFVLATRNKTNY